MAASPKSLSPGATAPNLTDKHARGLIPLLGPKFTGVSPGFMLANALVMLHVGDQAKSGEVTANRRKFAELVLIAANEVNPSNMCTNVGLANRNKSSQTFGAAGLEQQHSSRRLHAEKTSSDSDDDPGKARGEGPHSIIWAWLNESFNGWTDTLPEEGRKDGRIPCVDSAQPRYVATPSAAPPTERVIPNAHSTVLVMAHVPTSVRPLASRLNPGAKEFVPRQAARQVNAQVAKQVPNAWMMLAVAGCTNFIQRGATRDLQTWLQQSVNEFRANLTEGPKAATVSAAPSFGQRALSAVKGLFRGHQDVGAANASFGSTTSSSEGGRVLSGSIALQDAPTTPRDPPFLIMQANQRGTRGFQIVLPFVHALAIAAASGNVAAFAYELHELVKEHGGGKYAAALKSPVMLNALRNAICASAAAGTIDIMIAFTKFLLEQATAAMSEQRGSVRQEEARCLDTRRWVAQRLLVAVSAFSNETLARPTYVAPAHNALLPVFGSVSIDSELAAVNGPLSQAATASDGSLRRTPAHYAALIGNIDWLEGVVALLSVYDPDYEGATSMLPANVIDDSDFVSVNPPAAIHGQLNLADVNLRKSGVTAPGDTNEGDPLCSKKIRGKILTDLLPVAHSLCDHLWHKNTKKPRTVTLLLTTQDAAGVNVVATGLIGAGHQSMVHSMTGLTAVDRSISSASASAVEHKLADIERGKTDMQLSTPTVAAIVYGHYQPEATPQRAQLGVVPSARIGVLRECCPQCVLFVDSMRRPMPNFAAEMDHHISLFILVSRMRDVVDANYFPAMLHDAALHGGVMMNGKASVFMLLRLMNEWNCIPNKQFQEKFAQACVGRNRGDILHLIATDVPRWELVGASKSIAERYGAAKQRA